MGLLVSDPAVDDSTARAIGDRRVDLDEMIRAGLRKRGRRPSRSAGGVDLDDLAGAAVTDVGDSSRALRAMPRSATASAVS